MLSRVLYGLSVIVCLASAQATPAARFGIKQIVIPGASSVSLAGINNSNTIIGTAVINGSADGFILQGGQVTMLPPIGNGCMSLPGNCTAFPTAINDRGEVAGSYSGGDSVGGFVWSSGAYVPTAYFPIASGVGSSGDVGGLNNAGELFFNVAPIEAQYQPPQAGVPPNLAAVTVPGLMASLTGLNRVGTLLATSTQAVGNSYEQVISARINGEWRTILPKGAANSTSGRLNDLNEIIGAYTDKMGSGSFMYRGGRYTDLKLPCPPLVLNNRGRIAGVCSSGTMTRLYWFNGTTATVFGHFPAGHGLSLALNDANFLLVSDQTAGTAYRVICAGSGC